MLASLVALLTATGAASGFGLASWLELRAPHVARRPRATLSRALAAQIERDLSAGAPADTPSAIRFALDHTRPALRFGLSHPTRLAFDAGEREGNCREYAELFARVFDAAARRGGLGARAWVVRSAARIAGQSVGRPGWRDHDWVLVVEPGASGRRYFVDPTLDDAGLGSDVEANVAGAVAVPSSGR